MLEHMIKRDKYLFVATNAGDAPGEAGAAHGLYYGDTRMLSRYALSIDPGSLSVVAASARAGDSGRIVLLGDELNSIASPPRELVLERRPVIRDGLIERIEMTNYGADPCPVRLTIDLESDFRDMFEVRGLVRERRGQILPPDIVPDGIRFRYRGLDDMEYMTEIRFEPAPDDLALLPTDPETEASMTDHDGPLNPFMTDLSVPDAVTGSGDKSRSRDNPGNAVRVAFDLQAMRGAPVGIEVHVTASVAPIAKHGGPTRRNESSITDDLPSPSSHSSRSSQPQRLSHAEALSASQRDRDEWLAGTATWRTDNAFVNEMLDQSVRDIRMLLNDFGLGPMPTAGVPWYAAPFGRDSLIAAAQSLSVRPDIAAATLRTLARWQGTKYDPHLDEAPGKILHELRNGELARTKEIPFIPYYGIVDATPLFLITAGEYWRWTGDMALIYELLPSLRRAAQWLDSEADTNGYIAYHRRHEGGLVNQGWKDSNDAVVHRDGSLAKPSIALAEVQGYVYAARMHFAKLLEAWADLQSERSADGEGRSGRDASTAGAATTDSRAAEEERSGSVAADRALAAEQRRRARLLKKAFNRDFWVDETKFYALALDGDKRPVGAVSSNPGHCLWSGIIAPERADAVVKTLLSDEMFSGYGIRTLSSAERAYNPLSYHRGTVWPHDNSVIAMGLARYGYGAAAARVAAGLFATASFDQYRRLPELFGGYSMGVDGPVSYPVACIPQAWAAATPFLLLQAALGLEADIPNDRLSLAPHLPAGINRVELTNLVLGDRRLHISVERRPGTDECDWNVEILAGPPLTVEPGGNPRVHAHFNRSRPVANG